jgi:hypothetical protein
MVRDSNHCGAGNGAIVPSWRFGGGARAVPDHIRWV